MNGRLLPGEHTAASVEPWPQSGGRGYVSEWTVALPDGRVLRRQTKGRTKTATKARAKQKAEELLTSGVGATWTGSSRLEEYIEQVAKAAIESAQLSPRTRDRYLPLLDLLVGRCSAHQHRDSLKKMPIASAGRFRVLESALQEIARLHGAGTARQARNVLSGWVLRPLVRDGIIPANVLAGERIHFDRTLTDTKVHRGGVAVGDEAYDRLLDGLLALDPAENIVRAKRGPGRLAARVAKAENVRLMTLVQMVAGLRIGEVLTLTWERIDRPSEDDDVVPGIYLPGKLTKTGETRTVPILDTRVHDALEGQREAVGGVGYVVGTPSDRSKMWDKDNAQAAVRETYRTWAKTFDVPELETARSHVWRTTLNMKYMHLPDEIRTLFFGNSRDVRQQHYTDYSRAAEVLAAAHRKGKV